MIFSYLQTDMASMLDEVIAYTKQLRVQVEMMKLMRSSSSNNNNGNNHVNIPQMMNTMMMMLALLPCLLNNSRCPSS